MITSPPSTPSPFPTPRTPDPRPPSPPSATTLCFRVGALLTGFTAHFYVSICIPTLRLKTSSRVPMKPSSRTSILHQPTRGPHLSPSVLSPEIGSRHNIQTLRLLRPPATAPVCVAGCLLFAIRGKDFMRASFADTPSIPTPCLSIMTVMQRRAHPCVEPKTERPQNPCKNKRYVDGIAHILFSIPRHIFFTTVMLVPRISPEI